ncbi:MAG: hypothetical protein ACRDMV_03680 [Streptosporangiales bacterium]
MPGRGPRRWTLIGSVILVGLLVLGAVYVVLSEPSEAGHDPSAATTPTAPAASEVPSPTYRTPDAADDCAADTTSQRLPTTTPKDITWSVWNSAALPASKSAGPLETNEKTGVTSCYARTPVGAVMAAINISYRASLAAPDTTIIKKQVADGHYKKQLVDVAANYEAPRSIPQVAGFQIVDYQRSQALVAIAVGSPETGLGTSTTTVAWEDGTWKMVAGADDLTGGGGWTRIDDLSGYIPLKGVG